MCFNSSSEKVYIYIGYTCMLMEKHLCKENLKIFYSNIYHMAEKILYSQSKDYSHKM